MRSPYLIGVFLAAGNSKRMGQNKLALPLKEETIGLTFFETACRPPLIMCWSSSGQSMPPLSG